MYKLFLKIATRYLLKNKLYSFINIFGLAMGVASFVLILLYVNYERSYDKFEGSENIQRVYMEYAEGGIFTPGDAQTYSLSGPTLKKEFPEIVEQLRLYQMGEITFEYKGKIIEDEYGSMADDSYFDIFNYPVLSGEADEILKKPYSIVLTETLSQKIFGKEDPLGKTLSVFYSRMETQFTVTGIMKDTPKTTHMKTNYLVSFNTIRNWDVFEGQHEFNWNQNNFFTYLKLADNTNVEQLRKKVIKKDYLDAKDQRHNIEPLEDIHLYSDKPYEAEANGSISRIKFLSAIALVILLLSWLNYINLATAKSLERAKETGIRKVAGAQRPQLIIQSLLESLLLNSIAVVLAFLIVALVLPTFQQFTGLDIEFGISSWKSILPILLFVVFGALLSGIYPAFVLSKFTPAKALMGKVQNSAKGVVIRKGLITLQFLTTIILLVGTILVTKQIQFLRDQPIGVSLNQVIALNGEVVGKQSESLGNGFRSLGTELEKLSMVESFTTSSTYPGDGYYNLQSSKYIEYPNGTVDKNTVQHSYVAGKGYFELMDMEFLAGRTFLGSDEKDSKEVVINRKVVENMGFNVMEDALGKQIKFFGTHRTIVGVIDNYHHFGLKTAITPVIIRQGYVFDNQLVKLSSKAVSTSELEGSITQIESIWKSVFPESTFNYTFLDKKFQAQYTEEAKFGSAFQIFTILAILIASMGLFGLTSYTVLQRRKEIGIRKVNGASIAQILKLLNKDFVKWVCLAFVIAVPISWYVMDKWLEGFAYKTTISWWIFALAGLTALVIALLTISWQSFRAATNNPVDALRDE